MDTERHVLHWSAPRLDPAKSYLRERFTRITVTTSLHNFCNKAMASSLIDRDRTSSPDPASHALNHYDAVGPGGESVDEADDDDMDFEPTTDGSEDAEFFDPTEDIEAEFHGPLNFRITCKYCASAVT